MARTKPTIGEILKVLPSFSAVERKRLLDVLCRYPDLVEDLRDIIVILERKEEPPRSYEEFTEELRAEGRL